MNNESLIPWQWLAENSGAAFIVAGLLVIAAPTAGLLDAPRAVTVPLSLLANLVAAVGLLGLYPRLAEYETGLARGGALSAAFSLLAIIATIVLNAVASLTGASGSFQQGAPGTQILIMAIVLTAMISFTLYAIASLRSGALPGPSALLLLAVAVFWLLAVGLGIVFQDNPVLAATTLSVAGLAQLGIGYFLQTETTESSTA